LIEQMKDFISFSGYRSIYDPDYLPVLLKTIVEQHLCLVTEEDGVRTGTIAGWYIPHPYNPKKKLLAELFWWVPRNHRHTRAGSELLTAYMEWGKQHADMVTLCTLKQSPVNPRTMEKRGFMQKETTFVWEKQ
jgi:RimJ/RimL family protein N-acetyltransferase